MKKNIYIYKQEKTKQKMFGLRRQLLRNKLPFVTTTKAVNPVARRSFTEDVQMGKRCVLWNKDPAFDIHVPEAIQLVVLDGSGTLVDPGCMAPAVVLVDTFASFGIDISIEEAREPMGLEKRAHIGKILEMPRVAERWKEIYGRFPSEMETDHVFTEFVPRQLVALQTCGKEISGASDTLEYLKQLYPALKLGFSTGFNRIMVDTILQTNPRLNHLLDVTVAADEVPRARPAPFMIHANQKATDVCHHLAVLKVGDTPMDIQEGKYNSNFTVGLSLYSSLVGLTEVEVEEMQRTNPAEFHALHYSAGKQLYEAGADYVVNTIAELPFVLLHLNKRLADMHARAHAKALETPSSYGELTDPGHLAEGG